jgi:P pilus assembly chaperone PapD
MLKNGWKPSLGFVMLLSLSTLNLAAQAAWTFKVTNNGKSPIERVEASEDGKTWGAFSGSTIAPGETATMEWAPSTDNSNCVWQVRAIYADGASEPASFDFCKQPHLEFTN